MNMKVIIKTGAVFAAGAIFALNFIKPVEVSVHDTPDKPDDEDCRRCEEALLEMMKQVSEEAAERSGCEEEGIDFLVEAQTIYKNGGMSAPKLVRVHRARVEPDES